jgi:uncharacterized repeat protein (TIGR02543 family)
MKYKKIISGMLAAVMAAGSLQGAVVAEASQVKKIKVNTVANATEASAFEFDEDTATITKYLGSDAQVIIPDVIDGNDVETIGEVAFASNEYVKEVVIPEGVTTIEGEAFLNCPNLETVSIPNKMVTIEPLAFFMCENLETINLGQKLTEIPENAFYGCSDLKKIALPNTVKEIYEYAFMGCSSLEKVAIPNNVTHIGMEAFKDCDNLKEISIPSKVKTIEAGAISGSNVTIVCEEGSVAESYAEENKIAVKIVDEVNNVTADADLAPCVNVPTVTPEPEVTEAPEKTTYTIQYVLEGGKISGKKVESYDGKSNIALPKATRRNYTFLGWYKESTYKTKVTAIKKGTTGNLKLYAKWEKVKKPSKPTISSVKNNKSKKITVKLKKKVSGAKGYELIYATDRKFTKNEKTVRFTSTSKTISKLKKGKTYYVKVRAYKLDSANNRVYGAYSSVKKVKIKK